MLSAAKTVLLSQEINPISIGDNIPKLKIERIINYTSQEANLEDFKGKLLILDFWATWCSPCIKAFPKIDSLQKKFGDKILILPVTMEKQQVVSSFFERMKKSTSLAPLPSVVEDKDLTKLFTHIELPHCVWINSEGKVIAITEGSQVNSENIEKILKGENIALKVKKDIKLDIINNSDQGIPIFSSVYKRKEGNSYTFEEINSQKSLIQSTLTGYTEGLSSGAGRFVNMISVFNVPVIWLYKVAFWKGQVEMLSEDRTIVEVEENNIYEKLTTEDRNNNPRVSSGVDYENWLRSNGYCYELKVPKELDKDKFDFMLDDLNRAFGSLYGIEGQMQNKKLKCLALVRTSKEDKIASKSTDPKVLQSKFTANIRKGKISTLISVLTQPLQNYPPLIDESNYSGRIDIDLECDLGNLVDVNKELAKFDLSLVEKEMEIKVGIIKSKSKLELSKF